ncbi:50S ribosomal protein L21, partial [Gammaproteobacteria bacterium]|nr:50S ribosomal protein L21 [Gammaproteobacteria bacterium]
MKKRAMYAVVKTGGKQYRVSPGDILIVEKLIGDAGAKVKLDNVLIVGEDGKDPEVGVPIIFNAAVNCEVVEQSRADKVVVFKKKRRQGYKRKRGHRQDQTVLRVLDINGKGALKTPAEKTAKPKASGLKPKVAEKPKSDTSKTVKAKASIAKKSSEVKSPAPKKETAAGKELAVSEANVKKK